MTTLRCFRCNDWWTVHTLHPDIANVTTKFCPTCIPIVLPPLGLLPFPRRIA